MPGQACSIEPVEKNRLMVRLRGMLEDQHLQVLSDDLLPRVRELGAKGGLIIDMQELDSCTGAARMRLIELQRSIAELGARTAFVANRPRFRGLSLYVAHLSEDPNARAFHLLSQAHEWLQSHDGRIIGITNYIDRARQSPRRGPLRPPSSDELRMKLKKLRDSSDEEGSR